MKCSQCPEEVGRRIRGMCLRCYRKLSKREARKDPKVREHRRKNDRVRYAERKTELSEYRKQRTQELKTKVFALFGSKCNWHEGCSWTDPRALQIDHVKDDGNLDRRANGKDQAMLYLKILRCEKPAEKYQLLCANHNWVKRSGESLNGGALGWGSSGCWFQSSFPDQY